MRGESVLVVLLAVACERGSNPGASQGPSVDLNLAGAAARSGQPGNRTPSTVGSTPEADVLRRLCREATCAGPFSSIQVHRETDPAAVVYVLSGDPRRCSHPPTSYFDASGKQILVQALKPVVPGSAEAKRFIDERNNVLAGLKQAESHSCSKLE